MEKNELADKYAALAARIEERLGDRVERLPTGVGELSYRVEPDDLIACCEILRDEEPFKFELLMDVCGVDYLDYGRSEWTTSSATETGFSRGVQREPVILDESDEFEPRRFAVVYHLLSLQHNLRLRLRAFTGSANPPMIKSVVGIWNSANWFEREAFDLYGILFDGHPDLRRILTDYGFIGHPFRKDFPLIGQVEMRYDPEQQRVIYQPVTIKQRPQVPKVVRDDNRYLSEEQKPQGGTDA